MHHISGAIFFIISREEITGTVSINMCVKVKIIMIVVDIIMTVIGIIDLVTITKDIKKVIVIIITVISCLSVILYRTVYLVEPIERRRR